jgi:hypothetical protein
MQNECIHFLGRLDLIENLNDGGISVYPINSLGHLIYQENRVLEFGVFDSEDCTVL